MALTSSELQAELARLRRFMREPSRNHEDDDNDNDTEAAAEAVYEKSDV